jgi:hypothetical protein
VVEQAPELRLSGYEVDIRGVAVDVVNRMCTPGTALPRVPARHEPHARRRLRSGRWTGGDRGYEQSKEFTRYTEKIGGFVEVNQKLGEWGTMGMVHESRAMIRFPRQWSGGCPALEGPRDQKDAEADREAAHTKRSRTTLRYASAFVATEFFSRPALRFGALATLPLERFVVIERVVRAWVPGPVVLLGQGGFAEVVVLL